nr:MAG TPA: hypothetical protein [Caudoviricetes sp.]
MQKLRIFFIRLIFSIIMFKGQRYEKSKDTKIKNIF